MKNKQRKSRAGTLIVIFICVALVFAVLWVVTTVLARLNDYGNSTSVAEKQEQTEQLPGASPSVPEDSGLSKNL